MTSKDRRFVYDAVWIFIFTIVLINFDNKFENVWYNLIHYLLLTGMWVYHVVKLHLNIK